MELDIYQPCPCGSGKKLKFCCCKDILPDLDRVLRMIEGEQRQQALDRLQQLLAKYPSRDALLALKVQLEVEMDRQEDLAKTVQHFVAHAPRNPVALSCAAWLSLSREDGLHDAVRQVQLALEQLGTQMPATVHGTLQPLARRLYEEGCVQGAVAHLAMLVHLAGDDEQLTAELEQLHRQIHLAPNVSPLLKEMLPLMPAPGGATWKREFDAVIERDRRWCWLAAAERLHSMSLRVLDEPAILHNLAVFRGRVGDNAGAAAAWRQYAAVRQVPLEQRVEAEALACLMDDRDRDEMVGAVDVTYGVEQVDAALEHLLSDRRVYRITAHEGEPDDGPPPKGVFKLLDRAMPDADSCRSAHDVPRVLGTLRLYGRQTDRGGRLVFSTLRTDDADLKQQQLQELVGSYLGPVEDESTTEPCVPAWTASVFDAHALPLGLPEAEAQSFHRQFFADAVLRRWPEVPTPFLDGRSLRAAAADPGARVRVLALILLREVEFAAMNIPEIDFNGLRRELGLAVPEPIDPAGVDVDQLPAARLLRLPLDRLATPQLLRLFRRSCQLGLQTVARRAALILIERTDLDAVRDTIRAYQLLARLAENTDEALRYLAEGRKFAAEHGLSVAPWLIQELALRFERGESAIFQKLFATIQQRYLHEPGIAEALLEMLYHLGLVDSKGRSVASTAPTLAQAATADDDESSAGRLWTPDQDQPVASASKLWVPPGAQ